MPAIVRYVQQESESWLGPLPPGLSQGGGPAACHPRPNSMKLTLCYHAQHSAGVPNSLCSLLQHRWLSSAGGDMIFLRPKVGLMTGPLHRQMTRQGSLRLLLLIIMCYLYPSYHSNDRSTLPSPYLTKAKPWQSLDFLRWMLNLTQYGLCQPWA